MLILDFDWFSLQQGVFDACLQNIANVIPTVGIKQIAKADGHLVGLFNTPVTNWPVTVPRWLGSSIECTCTLVDFVKQKFYMYFRLCQAKVLLTFKCKIKIRHLKYTWTFSINVTSSSYGALVLLPGYACGLGSRLFKCFSC